jgi:predicted dehydrogenase
VIGDPGVDAVYIATPPSTHREYTLAAAKAGKPVYVEKPMALNFAQCQEMIEACERARVPLFVAYYRRALPRFLQVKSWIDEGRIGKALAVSLRLFQKPSRNDLERIPHWRVDRAISGGGYFVDLGSHMIDLVQFLLGPIASVGGFTANQAGRYEVEDAVGATFRFESGVLGTGLWTFSAAENLDAVEIVGTKGRIRYATFENRPVTLEADGASESRSIPHPEHIQQPLIQSVVHELLGKGSCPSTGRSGATTSRIMDRVLAQEAPHGSFR